MPAHPRSQIFTITGLLLTLVLSSAAQAKSCGELADDLALMQKAQSSLLDSMVHKNESMASTLDQYAQNFSTKKVVRKEDVVSLKKSGQAFRSHGEREEKLVLRFEKKSVELIEMVQQCLKSKTIAAE